MLTTRAAVSLLLGVFSVAFLPGWGLHDLLRGDASYADAALVTEHRVSLAAACGTCVSLCAMFFTFYRFHVGRRGVLEAAALLAVLSAVLPWVGSLTVCAAVFCLATVARFVLWLSVSQIQAVLEPGGVCYCVGLALGALTKALSAPAVVGGYVSAVDAALGLLYAVVCGAVLDSDCVEEAFSDYRSIYVTPDDLYRRLRYWQVLRVTADALICGLCLCVVGAALRETSAGGFLVLAFLAHLRLADAVGAGQYFAACALAGLALVARLLVGGGLLRVAEDLAFAAAGCALRNYVLDRFRKQDVFLGNTACAVTAIFVLPFLPTAVGPV